MSDSPFKVIGNRNGDGAINWIKFTIDIALNIINHRLTSKENYTEEEFHINELITRELLGRNIWKFSEAYGKFRGCPFWSVKAFDHFVSMKKQNKTKAEYEKNLSFFHSYVDEVYDRPVSSNKDFNTKTSRRNETYGGYIFSDTSEDDLDNSDTSNSQSGEDSDDSFYSIDPLRNKN